jgi:hypothetical protein
MGAPAPIQEHESEPSPAPPRPEASSLLEAESSPRLLPPSLTTKARIVSGEGRSELQEDRMAIMAAVAMTELLGAKSPRRVSMDASKNPSVGEKHPVNEDASPPPQPPRSSSSTTYDSPPSLTDSPSEEEQHLQQTQNPHKRLRVTETSMVVSTETSPVRGMPVHEESRNPSPATTTAMTYQSRLPLHHLHPSTGGAYPYPQRQAPPQHYHQHSPPPKHFSYYASPTRGPPPPPLHHAPPRFSPTTTTSCYEDVTKSSGLPKALSFRKICSKCGKTRGEHGELGFGNKCVYQDCGKCGAGVQMHLKAGVPMGILCRLTVDEGAIPGASASYERKISDLATRAELQKTLFHDKRERAARMAQVYP